MVVSVLGRKTISVIIFITIASVLSRKLFPRPFSFTDDNYLGPTQFSAMLTTYFMTAIEISKSLPHAPGDLHPSMYFITDNTRSINVSGHTCNKYKKKK
jgi:hypothetical protein